MTFVYKLIKRHFFYFVNQNFDKISSCKKTPIYLVITSGFLL